MCMTLHTESIEDQTDHFTDVVREHVACGYNVATRL